MTINYNISIKNSEEATVTSMIKIRANFAFQSVQDVLDAISEKLGAKNVKGRKYSTLLTKKAIPIRLITPQEFKSKEIFFIDGKMCQLSAESDQKFL